MLNLIIMQSYKYTNALINSGSLYLQQHAHNPVNWQPWSDDLTDQAMREDKLLLISIGYSSCHWCHVMEHECFEKEDTAALMNKHFICVKVDREERPDIDQLYMDAVQLLTGRGGWPLNVFALPDGRPIHGGTYFPKAEWEKILLTVADYYQNRREDAFVLAHKLSQGIKNLDVFNAQSEASSAFQLTEPLLQRWKQQFDTVWGGYQWAPKFPLPNQWELFMLYGYLFKQHEFTQAASVTLKRMYQGGIYDHVAGGFARYSTDSYWKVPHFEKMLYDNAQLLGTYAMASRLMSEPEFELVCEGIHQFLQSEMKSPEGLYYSALDADSEGVEGKFYVWEKQEIIQVLGESAGAFYCEVFNVEEEPNWEEGNILFRTTTISAVAEKYRITKEEVQTRIAQHSSMLLHERNKRVRPGLDQKLICSWNALTIKGYAQAYRYLGRKEYLDEAANGADAMLKGFMKDGQLLRIAGSHIKAFADDFAHLTDALLTLFEVSGSSKYLQQAEHLLQLCVKEYFDPASGLFAFTSNTQPVLVTRKLDVNDDVIPSSNSVLSHCLYKMAFYGAQSEGMPSFHEMMQKVLPRIEKYPNGFSNWMQLALLESTPFRQIVVDGQDAPHWVDAIRRHSPLHTIVLQQHKQSSLALLEGKTAAEGTTQAWICEDHTCGLPLNNLEEVLSKIQLN